MEICCITVTGLATGLEGNSGDCFIDKSEQSKSLPAPLARPPLSNCRSGFRRQHAPDAIRSRQISASRIHQGDISVRPARRGAV